MPSPSNPTIFRCISMTCELYAHSGVTPQDGSHRRVQQQVVDHALPISKDTIRMLVALIGVVPITCHHPIDLDNPVTKRNSDPVVGICRVTYFGTPGADISSRLGTEERGRLGNERQAAEVLFQR